MDMPAAATPRESTASKWISNTGDREEQGSVVTSSTSTSSPGPADAPSSTLSGAGEMDEKENKQGVHQQEEQRVQRQESQNPQNGTIRKSPDSYSRQQISLQSSEELQSLRSDGNENGKKNSSRRSSSRNKSDLVPLRLKRRQKGRYVRVADVNDTNEVLAGKTFPPLPRNQYRTVLRRRAIRKMEEEVAQDSASSTISVEEERRDSAEGEENQFNDEEYGDVSLGMKLIVAGGRVIVQKLIPLSDGRASPAQLVGVIQRGDVLLSIDNLSLVNLPIDQLMEALKPLSSPLGPGGAYQRLLMLRFETGVGMSLLENHEAAQKAANVRKEVMDAANDMFSLFPMVDQLSGTPIFEDDGRVDNQKRGATAMNPNPEGRSSQVDEEQELLNVKFGLPAHTQISSKVAQERIEDRERFFSDFYTYKDDLSAWLQTTTGMKYSVDNQYGMGMTQSQRLELGTKVMAVVKSLSYNMEELDRGADLRSFRKWNTTLSLRSRASVRRRHVLDSSSLPTNRLDSQSAIDEIESVNSGDTGSLEGVDGDELLLGLAAHDGIWRKQVLDTLKNAISEMENDSNDEKPKTKQAADTAQDIDSALTKELGTFLFGENMSRIIAQRKKSYALPPEEVTSVLFDLTTNIASTAPDEITVFGPGMDASRSIRSTQSKRKHALNSDVILATLFILDDALPTWLRSFRPLPWDQRRVLWPRLKKSSTDSYGGTNTIFSDDSLTVESANSSTRSPASKKNLREIIEDQELDIEARAETCFLVTYYFTQKILSVYAAKNQVGAGEKLSSVDQEPTAFIKKYGAYLQMHTSLTYAALLNAEAVICELLLVAEHDPSHLEAAREIRKGNTLMFYDHCKLSAVLKFLGDLRLEAKPERRQVCVNLCVSAYPDIQPWQVRQACGISTLSGTGKHIPCSEEIMSDLFYTYMSQLLHPLEGHDAARQDWSLVREWCHLSIRELASSPNLDANYQRRGKARLQNFISVASFTSSHHLVYRRDLAALLEMSMSIAHHDLALDLAGEILEIGNMMTKDILDNILRILRKIAHDAFAAARNEGRKPDSLRKLKRVLHLFHKMSTTTSPRGVESIVVANELHSLLRAWKKDPLLSRGDPDCLQLLDFFVAESAPSDVLHALYLWADSLDLCPFILPRLEEALRRGVNSALRSELSATLLRLRHARISIGGNESMMRQERGPAAPSSGTFGIFSKMASGNLTIDK